MGNLLHNKGTVYEDFWGYPEWGDETDLGLNARFDKSKLKVTENRSCIVYYCENYPTFEEDK